MKHIKWIVLILVLMAVCIGCGLTKSESTTLANRSTDQQLCHQMLIEFENAVQKAGVEDVQDARIEGYPYFRVNRFLHSFKNELTNKEKRMEWIKRAHTLGNRGRFAEIRNLPDKSFYQIFSGRSLPAAADAIIKCSESVGPLVANDPQTLNEIIEKAEVPSDYRTHARILGGYPISRWFILMGLKDLQKESKKNFQNTETVKDNQGNWYYPRRQRPDFSKLERRKILDQAKIKSALKIPEPAPDDLSAFFDYFAPVWHVLPRPGSDQIGRPYWKTSSEIGIDVSDPIVYRFHSFTRMNQDIFLQLNYVVWFPERPSDGFFDIYSGHLDGLIWRVTLDTDGSVLLYDSVHPCGCYHKYYPVSNRLSPLQHPPTEEPPLILDTDIPEEESTRVTIHLTGKEHYVIGLSPTADVTRTGMYIRNDRYDRLRSLPFTDGFKSMFGKDGLVNGTERKERFLVWSSGVPSAGAMRQQGHHALALVGKLYFDEPRLLEKVFILK